MKNDKGYAEKQLMMKYLCEPLEKHVRPVPASEALLARLRPLDLTEIKFHDPVQLSTNKQPNKQTNKRNNNEQSKNKSSHGQEGHTKNGAK